MSEEGRSGHEFAVACITMGALSYIFFGGLEKPIVAVVFGVLALRRLNPRAHKKYKVLAISGIVLGIIGIIWKMAARIHLAA